MVDKEIRPCQDPQSSFQTKEILMNITFIRATLIAALALFAGVTFAAPAEDPCKKPVVVHKAKKKAAKKAVKPAPAPIQETVIPTPTCSADGCGNTQKVVVEETIIKRVVKVEDICLVGGVSYPVKDGVCQSPTLTVTTPVVVAPSVTATCPNCNTRPVVPVVVAPTTPVATVCTDCHPELTTVKKVPRTDGRCVYEFVHNVTKEPLFVRFGLQNKRHLSAVRVTDMTGDALMKQFATTVGDGSATVQVESKDCAIPAKAITNPAILKWTAPRLGLQNCTPVGLVSSL